MNKPTDSSVGIASWKMERLEQISSLSSSLQGVQVTLQQLSSQVSDELYLLDAEAMRIVKEMRRSELV